LAPGHAARIVLAHCEVVNSASDAGNPGKTGEWFDRDSGDRDSGDRDVGDRDVGDRDVGDRDVGDRVHGQRRLAYDWSVLPPHTHRTLLPP
jgi:hypothetical protein